MHEGGEPAAVGVGDTLEPQGDAGAVADVDADALHLPRRLRLPVAVEADELVVLAQLVDQPRADEAAAPGDDDDRLPAAVR